MRINLKDVGIFMKNIKLGQTKFLNMAYLGSNIILNFAGVRVLRVLIIDCLAERQINNGLP